MVVWTCCKSLLAASPLDECFLICTSTLCTLANGLTRLRPGDSTSGCTFPNSVTTPILPAGTLTSGQKIKAHTMRTTATTTLIAIFTGSTTIAPCWLVIVFHLDYPASQVVQFL